MSKEREPYVVLNSGHTFKEADLKGTNALLYPRLGDWAVIKPTPTAKDPAAYEVVAAGLFDENWQFTGPVAEGAEDRKALGRGRVHRGAGRGAGRLHLLLGHRQPHHEVRPEDRQDDRVSRSERAVQRPEVRCDGAAVACEGANTGGGRRISITEKDGTVKTLADKFEGKRFNSPNDLTLDAQGPHLLQRSALRRRREHANSITSRSIASTRTAPSRESSPT